MLIKSAITGWESATKKEYNECYSLYGGSLNSHPDILDFMHSKADCKERYYVKTTSDGKLLGGICVWNNSHIAGDVEIIKKLKLDPLPINHDEIILPLSPLLKTILPFKTKVLSEISHPSILNSSITLNKKRVICLSKGLNSDGFSSKTKNTRNKELRKFLEAGGEIKNSAEFSAESLTDLYFELYEKRWGNKPDNRDVTIELLTQLNSMVFGSVLMLNGSPCAFQLILKCESPAWNCYDYVNGGVNTSESALSPGTVVTWLNVRDAFTQCQAAEKEMRYSFGKDSAQYKDRWCQKRSTGRIITL
ncbi:GNAT family N-acetyltransferase [Pragia fontium]|uniref:GNAT family N-acetyltransferase n=1 Tax=Pragia fontium TaxID=82985 RepID=UPI001F430C50|nr:GNAT family N-acetyltransferase [Pragia fontium]